MEALTIKWVERVEEVQEYLNFTAASFKSK